MRYYSVSITRSDGSLYNFKSLGNSSAPGITLSSLLPSAPQNPTAGVTNPAALMVEFDLPVANMTTPNNNCWFRVWGLGLQDLNSASDLNDLNISISAGMAKGLPLANPQQAGVIVTGKIFQSFGNWIGTAQTLDLNIIPGGNGGNIGSQDRPGNYPFQWEPGTPLSTAIAQTLKAGLPNLSQSINISSMLATNYVQTGHYPSLGSFAQAINDISSSILGGAYPGITIAINGGTISVFDGTVPATAATIKKIAFQDLIGQPTWIDAGTVSFKTVLRADIQVGDTVYLPPTPFTQSAASLQRFSNSPQNSLSFSGNFQVQQVQHFGNSRQADAASWNTPYQANHV